MSANMSSLVIVKAAMQLSLLRIGNEYKTKCLFEVAHVIR